MADRPTLSVVGGTAAPEADDSAEMAEMIAKVAARMAEATKTGGMFWVLTEVGGEIAVAYDGGRLESAAVAEEVARDMKRDALGMNE